MMRSVEKSIFDRWHKNIFCMAAQALDEPKAVPEERPELGQSGGWERLHEGREATLRLDRNSFEVWMPCRAWRLMVNGISQEARGNVETL